MKRLEFDSLSKLRAAALIVLVAGCTGLGRDSSPPEPIRIGSGEWMVAARDDSTAVLIRHPAASSPPGTPGTQLSADSAHTILYHSAGEVSAADIDSLILPVSDSTGGVGPAFAIVQADALRLAVIPGRSPALVGSPGKPDSHLFESIDGIWGIDADLLPEPVTSRRVGIYDYVQLRGRQREGAVILYWATAPIWSPSGDIVAYATNREAVYRDEPGQSIWTIDLESGDENPLVEESRRSFRPVGWLGEDVVFIGDMPGVWAAELETGARRELASSATFVDWARDGSAIAVAYGVPDSTRLQVIRHGDDGALDRMDLPGPPNGAAYLSDAIFSPDGTRLLLTVLRDETRREHWVYDLGTGLADPVPAVAGFPTGRPAWVMDDAILVHVILPESGGTEAWIVPFSPLNGLADLDGGAPATDVGPGNREIDLAVQPGTPGEVRERMQALIEGTLVLRERCVRLQTTSEATEYLLVWPPGYTARERDRAILNERGEVFARVGDRVRLGGGEVAGAVVTDTASSSSSRPLPFSGSGACEGPFWIVGEVQPSGGPA